MSRGSVTAKPSPIALAILKIELCDTFRPPHLFFYEIFVNNGWFTLFLKLSSSKLHIFLYCVFLRLFDLTKLLKWINVGFLSLFGILWLLCMDPFLCTDCTAIADTVDAASVDGWPFIMSSLVCSPFSQYVSILPFPFISTRPRSVVSNVLNESKIVFVLWLMWIFKASPFDSILDAVFTVSPNRQYRGIFKPTTPATHEPMHMREGTKFLVGTFWMIFLCPYRYVIRFGDVAVHSVGALF